MYNAYQTGLDALWAALGVVGVNHYEMMHTREPNDVLKLAARKLLELHEKTKGLDNASSANKCASDSGCSIRVS